MDNNKENETGTVSTKRQRFMDDDSSSTTNQITIISKTLEARLESKALKEELEKLKIEYGSSEIINRERQLYEAELNEVNSKVIQTYRLNYGVVLAFSGNRQNNYKGIELLSEQLDLSPLYTSDCLLYMAIAKYNLGEYRDGRILCEDLLKREPTRVSASNLYELIRAKVKEDGRAGLGLVFSVIVFAAIFSKFFITRS